MEDHFRDKRLAGLGEKTSSMPLLLKPSDYNNSEAEFCHHSSESLPPHGPISAPWHESINMKDATLFEYGSPIDAQIMVTPPDVTELELEPGHPGLGDEAYIQRRKELFALCRKHRLEELGPPIIDYPAEETRIWQEVSPKLDQL